MLYWISARVLRLMFLLSGGFRTVGEKNVPATGGVILAPNHISYVDPPAVGVGTKRQLHFMAKEELFKGRLLRAWIVGVGGFPVRRGTADRKAIKRAIELLAEGKVVCLFPEGTRSPDGKLQAPELGIGLIALKSKAPIVPVALIGTDKVLPAHAKWLHKHLTTVVYGEPLTFPEFYEGKESRESMEEIGRRVMGAIADLQAAHTR